jgi:hydroxylamine dehydrogenase
MRIGFAVLSLSIMASAASSFGQTCVDCHRKVTPNVVSDWQLSKHSSSDVNCSVCHGDRHMSAQDVDQVNLPTPETCALCHAAQVQQFADGKHSKAWAAMKAMPAAHWQPMELMEGMKGCGGCHQIGLKTEAEVKELTQEGGGFGLASCDACHTRHIFSTLEANQPQACRTCHMGIDHPQWEMYSSSKHGVRYLLKQVGKLPEEAAAPTCQICHMRDGDHAVRTAWGFLAVRLPMPQDETWAADRITVLQGLGVLDPDGNPTARLDVVKAADVARLTQEDWEKERGKMLAVCSRCHSRTFAQGELEKGDRMIKQADHLMAQGIRIVAGLYQDGVIPQPEQYAYPFPDLLAFNNAPTVIEQQLFLMYLEHRMRTFQGAFHANPDYAFWYGWSEMQRDLTEIQSMAQDLRRQNKAGKK